MDSRQKEFDVALRKLTPVFQRQLAAKDVRHDLYGRDQLTWNEYERIGEIGLVRGAYPSRDWEREKLLCGNDPSFMRYICSMRCGKDRRRSSGRADEGSPQKKS